MDTGLWLLLFLTISSLLACGLEARGGGRRRVR